MTSKNETREKQSWEEGAGSIAVLAVVKKKLVVPALSTRGTTSKAREERRNGKAVFLGPGPGIDMTRSLVFALRVRFFCDISLKKKLALNFG